MNQDAGEKQILALPIFLLLLFARIQRPRKHTKKARKTPIQRRYETGGGGKSLHETNSNPIPRHASNHLPLAPLSPEASLCVNYRRIHPSSTALDRTRKKISAGKCHLFWTTRAQSHPSPLRANTRLHVRPLAPQWSAHLFTHHAFFNPGPDHTCHVDEIPIVMAIRFPDN